jgi:hypothetical protein
MLVRFAAEAVVAHGTPEISPLPDHADPIVGVSLASV